MKFHQIAATMAAIFLGSLLYQPQPTTAQTGSSNTLLMEKYDQLFQEVQALKAANEQLKADCESRLVSTGVKSEQVVKAEQAVQQAQAEVEWVCDGDQCRPVQKAAQKVIGGAVMAADIVLPPYDGRYRQAYNSNAGYGSGGGGSYSTSYSNSGGTYTTVTYSDGGGGSGGYSGYQQQQMQQTYSRGPVRGLLKCIPIVRRFVR